MSEMDELQIGAGTPTGETSAGTAQRIAAKEFYDKCWQALEYDDLSDMFEFAAAYAAQAISAERERIAKICDKWYAATGAEIAEEIRYGNSAEPPPTCRICGKAIWLGSYGTMWFHAEKDISHSAVRCAEPPQEEKPLFVKGQRVRVDHPRFCGEGIVQYDSGSKQRVVGVLLENGNTWEYEVETVKLAAAHPKEEK